MNFSKHGGLWFWRIGRLGGTFYWARKPLAVTWVDRVLGAIA